MSINAKDRRFLVWLLLLVSVAHGLLLLNTGLYWDDYMLVDWLKEGDWARLLETGRTMGNLGYTLMYWPFHFLGDPTWAMKLVVFICLCLTACFIYLAAFETGLLDRREAFFVAAVSVIYPGHMMTFAVNVFGHFVSYAGFAVAAWCTLRSESTTTLAPRRYRVAAWAAFILSFVTPSFLAFHFGFLLVLYLCLGLRLTPRPGLSASVVHFLRRQWDLLLLPLLFWAIHRWLNPVTGWAKAIGYNEIRFERERMSLVYDNLQDVVLGQWLKYGNVYVVSFGVMLLLAWLARRRGIGAGIVPSNAKATRGKLALAIGIIWLVLAAFPYAAVGKDFGLPQIVDWQTRNRLLLQLPLAVILLGLADALFRPQLKTSLLGAILMASTLVRVDNYMVWEAQAIKDESIRHNLARLPGIRGYHLMTIHDKYEIVDPSWHANDAAKWWSYVLKLTFGDFTRFGIYEPDQKRASARERYTADEVSRLPFRDKAHPPYFDPSAPQAGLIVERGPLGGKRRMVVSYFLAKIRGSDALEKFLSGVTWITLVERR